METAVALPTLTPLQISFSWGGRHVGWIGLRLSVTVCGAGSDGTDDGMAGCPDVPSQADLKLLKHF